MLANCHVRLRLVSLLIVFLLYGCAVSPEENIYRSTDFEPFIPPGATTYQMAENQRIVLGEPVIQPAPSFPDNALNVDGSRTTVCLELAIGRDGGVITTRPLQGLAGCDSSGVKSAVPFMEAAQKAAIGWQFEPAVLCIFPKEVDAHTKGTDCISEGAIVEPIAIKLAFAFTFRVIEGESSVGSHRLQ